MQLYESTMLAWLWLLPSAALLWFLGSRLWQARLRQLGNVSLLQNRLMPGFSRTRRRTAWFFLLGVFFLSSLALARPQWGEEKKKIERKGIDLVFLLDTSLSMLAEDVKPNRLGKSKLEIKNLLRYLTGDRVGMIAFSGSSFLQCPLTLDYSAFLLFVDALRVGYIPNPGTSLARAIELGLRAFPQDSGKYRALIVFSDGEDHEGGMEQALNAAKKSGVRIYTIGTGTDEGEPIPLRPAPGEKPTGYKKDRDGQVVITRLNPQLLDEIAKETGGLFFRATASEKETDIILKHLETLGERQLKERLVTEREDHFQVFVFLAFLLLVGETLLEARKGRAAWAPVPLAVLALFVLSGFWDPSGSLVKKANREVQEKKYKSAVDDYRKAQVSRPHEPVIRYNLGTALYQLFEYRDAEKELEQALDQAPDKATQAKILYNYGNTKYRLGDFEKAIEAYKKALDLNPKDEDAKFNLEFLKNKKSLFEKQQQEQQQQKQNKQPNQQQDEQQQQQQNERQQKQDQEQSQSQQPQPQPQQPSDQNQKQDEQSGQGRQKEEEQKGSQSEEDKSKDEPSEGPEGKQDEKEEEEPQPKSGASGQEEKNEQTTPESKEERPEPQGAQANQEPKTPLQGQMSKENALRILEALRASEKELQDSRRPPAEADQAEVLKDW